MKRQSGLDLLRAVAIVWVMLYHASIMGLGSPLPTVAAYGWMGVDLFFVLSGYLIGTQWLKDVNHDGAFQRFYARRIFRILPAYLVVTAIYFALPSLRERPDIMPLWQFLSFTENWFIDASKGRAFSHVWSLCVEEHFYLLFPLISWLLLKRPSASRTTALILIVLTAGIVWRAWLWNTGISVLPEDGPGNLYQRFMEQIYYPTWTRLDGLLAGVCLALLRVYRPVFWERLMSASGWLTGAAAGLLALAFWLFREGQVSGNAFIGYPVIAAGFACLLVVSVNDRSWLGRWKVPFAGTLALLAYSLYLTHKMMFKAVRTLGGPWLQDHGVAAFFICALAALLAGGVLYLLVETRSGI